MFGCFCAPSMRSLSVIGTKQECGIAYEGMCPGRIGITRYLLCFLLGTGLLLRVALTFLIRIRNTGSYLPIRPSFSVFTPRRRTHFK